MNKLLKENDSCMFCGSQSPLQQRHALLYCPACEMPQLDSIELDSAAVAAKDLECPDCNRMAEKPFQARFTAEIKGLFIGLIVWRCPYCRQENVVPDTDLILDADFLC